MRVPPLTYPIPPSLFSLARRRMRARHIPHGLRSTSWPRHLSLLSLSFLSLAAGCGQGTYHMAFAPLLGLGTSLFSPSPFSRSPPDAGKAHTIWLSLHFLAYGTSLSSVDPERMHLCSINPFSKCIGAVTRSCRCSCVCVALCCPQVFFLTAVSLGLSLPV